MDVSPRGYPPGLIQILDDRTFVIPDRSGNRHADTFRNVLQNPHVGLIFLIPGKQETLRVSGTARITRDHWVREPMAIDGKIPDFAADFCTAMVEQAELSKSAEEMQGLIDKNAKDRLY